LEYQRSFQVLLDYWDDVLQPMSSDTRRYLIDQLSQLGLAQGGSPTELAREVSLILDHVLPGDDHPARPGSTNPAGRRTCPG
jgi:hypothetical protein